MIRLFRLFFFSPSQMEDRAAVFLVGWNGLTDEAQDFVGGGEEFRRENPFPQGRRVPLQVLFDDETAIAVASLKHGDLVKIGEEYPYFFIYDAERGLAITPGEFDGNFVVPETFAVPSDFPPRYWFNAEPLFRYVDIVPLDRQLGGLDSSQIFLSPPDREGEQHMVIPFVVDNTIYYIADTEDVFNGISRDVHGFLENIRLGNQIQVSGYGEGDAEDIDAFGVDKELVLPVTRRIY